MKSFVRFVAICIAALIKGIASLLLVLSFYIAVASLLLALLVRGWSFIDKEPSLRSFDPQKRIAAAEQAGRIYGEKK